MSKSKLEISESLTDPVTTCIHEQCPNFGKSLPYDTPEFMDVEAAVGRVLLIEMKRLREEYPIRFVSVAQDLLSETVKEKIKAGKRPSEVIEGWDRELAMEIIVNVVRLSLPVRIRSAPSITVIFSLNEILHGCISPDFCYCLIPGSAADIINSLEGYSARGMDASHALKIETKMRVMIPSKDVLRALVMRKIKSDSAGEAEWKGGEWRTTFEIAAKELLKFLNEASETVANSLINPANWKVVMENIVSPLRILALSSQEDAHPGLVKLESVAMNARALAGFMKEKQQREKEDKIAEQGKRFRGAGDATKKVSSAMSSFSLSQLFPTSASSSSNQPPADIIISLPTSTVALVLLVMRDWQGILPHITPPPRSTPLYHRLPRLQPLLICSPHHCSQLAPSPDTTRLDGILLDMFKTIFRTRLVKRNVGSTDPACLLSNFIRVMLFSTIVERVILDLPTSLTTFTTMSPSDVVTLDAITRSACETIMESNSYLLGRFVLGHVLDTFLNMMRRFSGTPDLPCLCTLAHELQMPTFPDKEEPIVVEFPPDHLNSLAERLFITRMKDGLDLFSSPDLKALIHQISEIVCAHFESADPERYVSDYAETFEYIGGINLYSLLLRDTPDVGDPRDNSTAGAICELLRMAINHPDALTRDTAVEWKYAANEIYRGHPTASESLLNKITTMYTVSTLLDPSLVASYTNLAMLKLKKDTPASMNPLISECSFALHFDPDNVKALYRRAVALINIECYSALLDLGRAVHLDPSNAVVKERWNFAWRKIGVFV